MENSQEYLSFRITTYNEAHLIIINFSNLHTESNLLTLILDYF